jgi:hypothetical protein
MKSSNKSNKINKLIKFFPIIMGFLMPFSLVGAEQSVLVQKSEKFIEYFNQSDSKGVHKMFSVEMKQAIPLAQLEEVLSQFSSQYGVITEKEFVRYENTYGIFNIEFLKNKSSKELLTLKISLDEKSEINGLFFAAWVEHPILVRNESKLILPFEGEWWVFWGGDTKEENYHVESNAQKGAFDFLIKDQEGKSFRNEGKTNEEYYAFGKRIISPSDGEVVLVVDGVKDNIPGKLNPIYVPGNTVIIKTDNNEFLFFAHFIKNSIAVSEGQIVKQGDLLGLCGNSGNSSEPHLHFHIQNVEDINEATGAKAYFENILVDGRLKRDYSPIRKEKIKNIK